MNIFPPVSHFSLAHHVPLILGAAIVNLDDFINIPLIPSTLIKRTGRIYSIKGMKQFADLLFLSEM